jgi:hypothetical protein
MYFTPDGKDAIVVAEAHAVFSNSGVSLKQPGIGNAKRVDPL